MKLFLCLLITLLCGLAINAQKLTHRQGQVLVELKKGATASSTIRSLQARFGNDVKFESKQVIAVPMNVWNISFDHNVLNDRRVLRTLRGISGVFKSQFNHIIYERKTPNDTDFSEQWQYINIGQNGGTENADIDIDEAWDIATGGITATGDTIVACIIDDGIDPDHEDFGDNLWINYDEIPNNAIDDDGNGFVDDYLGWDTYEDTDNIYQEGFHGTPVAGIVGAQGDNGIGVTGVNWDVKLMIIRGGGDEANALASYAYPYIMRKRYNDSDGAEGAFVVSTNASWGIDYGQPDDSPLWCSFYDSLGMVGIINAGATINDNVDVDLEGDLPTACSSDFLISVSNITRNGSKEEFAGYGKTTIDIGAFGSETYTVEYGNGYGPFGGTSAASPHVAGAAALIYSAPYPELMALAKSNPDKAASLVKTVILEGAKRDVQFEELFVSSGVLNLKNSFSLLNNTFSDCPFPLVIDTERLNLDSTQVVWESPEEALSFDIRYKLENSEEWTEVTNVSSPFVISDLELCGMYEVQLKSYCEMDSISEYSFSERFTSLGCCNAPAGLEFSNDPEDAPENSVLITWFEDQDHTSYVLEYKDPEGDDWQPISTSNNMTVVPDLGFCTLYDFRVKAICLTTDETDYSEVIQAVTACGNCTTLDYCLPPSVVTFGEWIESVTIDGQEMNTGENFGYVNNSGFFKVNLNIGTDIEFKLDKGFSGGTFDEWVKVWVDLNIDGEFSDDEVVFDEGEATDIDIDTTIHLKDVIGRGFTIMRVGMVFMDEPIACNDPNNFIPFGEYEDFCVNLVGPCDYGLSIENVEIGETEATVNFTMVDTSIAYNVRFKIVGQSDDEWNTVSVLDTFGLMSPLEECTDYVVQVRAVCDADTSGFEAVTDTFKTQGADCTSTIFDPELPMISLQAMPNPFAFDFQVEVNMTSSEETRIDVVDMAGRKIHSQQLFLNAGKSMVPIEGSQNWKAGIYLLRFRSQEAEQTIKVIKIGG